MLTCKVAIQFLDYRHEIRIEAGDLNASITEAQLTAPPYLIVRFQNPDKDLSDAPLDYSFRARNLRMISGSTWLKRCIEGCSCECFIRQLLFEQRKLGMLPRRPFSAKCLANHRPVSGDDSTYLR